MPVSFQAGQWIQRLKTKPPDQTRCALGTAKGATIYSLSYKVQGTQPNTGVSPAENKPVPEELAA